MNSLANPNADWVVVYTTYNLPEAHIVVGRLHHEGIPAFVHQAPGASALGLNVGTMGAIHVVVRGADAEDALLVLDPDEPPLLDADTTQIIYEDDDDHE
jgi:acetaldehyde dehydrogenase (acetylating)